MNSLVARLCAAVWQNTFNHHVWALGSPSGGFPDKAGAVSAVKNAVTLFLSKLLPIFFSKLLPIFVYPLGLAILLGLFAFVSGRRIGRVIAAYLREISLASCT